MQGQPNRDISVIEPLSDASDRTKLILFNPFNMEKWFTIGLCVWLAQLTIVKGMNSFAFVHYGSKSGSFKDLPGFEPGAPENIIPPDLKNELMQHLPIMITIGVIIMVIALIFGAFLCWLNSRGRFMFLDNVANNTAQVSRPWSQHRKLGNSLFLFRIVVTLIGFVVMMLTNGVGAFIYYAFFHDKSEVMMAPIIISIIAQAALAIPFAVIFGLIFKFTYDFIVPIMYLRNCKCTQAWREFLDLAGRNKGVLTLYVLFCILLKFAISAIIIALSFACCLICCLRYTPYVSVVLLLPVYTFLRSYSLYFLRQFGDQFDVFPVIAQPGSPEPYVPVGVEPFQE